LISYVDLIRPLRPGRHGVAVGRQARLDEARRTANRTRGAPAHGASIGEPKSSGEGRGSSAAGALDGGLVRSFPGECINFGDELLGLVGAGIEVVTDPLC
jgi:hypothetical protein